jgi:uncharacterized SAM-binding protein YcdF (DUF218 family)
MKTFLALLLLIVVGGYAAGAVLFLLRDDDSLPARADAVVVLAGGETRLPVGLSLVRKGVAPVLVVSEDESGEDETRITFCKGGKVEGVEIVCRSAQPFSTRGEARLVASMARRRGWDTLVVVTSRYHLFRTERLFRRCTDATLVMRGAPESTGDNLLAIPREWAKLGLAETARRGC